jgi:hypothetical protein
MSNSFQYRKAKGKSKQTISLLWLSSAAENLGCTLHHIVYFIITIFITLKAYLPIENVRLLDATICTLSNKTIIMPVGFL